MSQVLSDEFAGENPSIQIKRTYHSNTNSSTILRSSLGASRLELGFGLLDLVSALVGIALLLVVRIEARLEIVRSQSSV